jgi:predicted outer membrane repeat protein
VRCCVFLSLSCCFVVGGALYSTVANSKFTVRNCVFESNRGSSGGGLYFGSDHIGISITASVVRANTGDYGGAIYFDQLSSEVSFVETKFESNLATHQGGVVYSLASDIIMTGCSVSHNKADAGSGLYYPSNTGDHKVNISSCLFENNIASGLYGAIWVESAVSVVIASSNFSRNQASTGSAIGIKVATVVSIEGCIFNGNLANDSAGAVYLDSGDAITVKACHFDSNVVKSGSGSAVWMTASSGVTIQNNRFIGNSAPNGSGAVFWVVSSGMRVPAGLEDTESNQTTGNYYEGNVAMYGSNLSTDAFALTLSGDNTYAVTNYDNYIPPVGVYVVDYYGQVVSTVSSGFVAASVSETAKCYENDLGYVTGGFNELVDSGLATFSSLAAYWDPGYNMTVSISSESNDVESPYFALAFRSCVRGEYYQDRICISCETGTYTTDPSTKPLSELRNSDVCKACPSGSKACYGDTIVLKEGYWRISDSSTALQVCPHGKHACRGGSGSGDVLCHEVVQK